MKIHIVQKGDTLWDIAQKYQIDFDQLKSLNVHLSSPDMIMPGMKIKIPMGQKKVPHQEKKKEPIEPKSSAKSSKLESKSFEKVLKPQTLPSLGDNYKNDAKVEKATYIPSSKGKKEQTKPSFKKTKQGEQKIQKNKSPIKPTSQPSPPYAQPYYQQPVQYYTQQPPIPCCQQYPYYYSPMQQIPHYVYSNMHPLHYPYTPHPHYYGQNISQPKR